MSGCVVSVFVWLALQLRPYLLHFGCSNELIELREVMTRRESPNFYCLCRELMVSGCVVSVRSVRVELLCASYEPRSGFAS